ncbi:hemerythrin domain-containing protein [Pseudanabaena mucicola]|uniref:hemerythrin domain-containing protein n=1 Tax=Pseudanabaena mucicola TaxID=71190 RepID=UPI0018EFAC79|nr:hemerythrin domain-containing protein [Pseudanabaena mucicola]
MLWCVWSQFAVSGIAGSIISRNDHEINICDLIRLDHVKVYSLFSQIKATDDPQKLEEYFGQVYQDLSAHSDAEEQVIYSVVRPYYNGVQKLYDEQTQMKQTLEQIKAMNSEDTVAFKAAVDLLATAVDDQQKQLATDFKTAKSKIQDQRLAAASQ